MSSPTTSPASRPVPPPPPHSRTLHSRPPHSRPLWWGWGTAEGHAPLAEHLRVLLADLLGAQIRSSPPVPIDAVELPETVLPPAARAALTAAVGVDHVRDDRDSRIRHCRGRSTVDLLRLRAGDASDAPDAVVFPADHDEVLAVLRACAEHRVAAVPFGGGTSVVGGLTPQAAGFAGVVALDLSRMADLLEVDPVSSTALVEPGMRGPELEAALAVHELTLGHVPQSFEYATVGGYAATRSSGQASTGYGRFDDLVVGLRVATGIGTWELGRAPASAGGPDLRQLVLGSEGAFGVITAVRLRVRPRPRSAVVEGWRLPGFAQGIDLLRGLAQAGTLPTVCRLSDETETLAGLANARTAGTPTTGGCYLVVGHHGSVPEVEVHRAALGPTLHAAGATPLGPEAGENWTAGRFHAPYLRDALLDVGVFAETLETAAFWADLPGLYAAAREALTSSLSDQGTPPLVMCHVSHVYPTGASLYLTVVCAQAADPVAQWGRAKAAATDAIVAAGGTITHHHAVGTDHRPWLAAEVGDAGIAVLRAVKAALDPAGVLNPGVLVP